MSTDHPRPLRWRAAAGIAAGLLGTAAALTAIAAAGGAPSPIQLAGVHEDQSGPCDEAEHANDPRCTGDTSTTVGDDGTSTTVGDTTTAPEGTTKTIDAAPAGTVVVTVTGGRLVVTSATPNAGWTLGEQRNEGREVEVRFTAATQRVDVKAEVEDGQIRSRVQVRVLTPGTSTTVPGTSSGPGSGGADDPAGHDANDDHGGQGNDDGAGHDVGDDHGDDGAGHDVGDDHGGGTDDSGHHGGDDSSGSGSGSGSSGSGSGGSGSGRDHPED